MCDRALEVAATAVKLIAKNVSVPVADIDDKGIDATVDDIEAVEKKMPPALATMYTNGIEAPLQLISLAPINDTRGSLAGADYRSTVLLFASECDGWAKQP